MEKIKTDRVLEIVAAKVLERTRAMSSLAEKQLLVDKIRDKAWYDDKQHMLTCDMESNSTIQKEMPAYNFLCLERVCAEYEEKDGEDIYGWSLYCFDSFDELREWFRKGVSIDLNIAYIEAIYVYDLYAYREVPVRYFLENRGKKQYISCLDFWEDEDEEIYRTLDIELVGLAEVHCGDKVGYHLEFSLPDIYGRIIFNELAAFTHPTDTKDEDGYFLYEGQKHPFILHTKDGGSWIDLFTPNGEQVGENRGFWKPDNMTEDEVIKSLQN